MRSSVLASLAAAALVGAQSAQPTPTAVNAPIVSTNPVGASYLAILPKKEGSNVAGSVTGQSAPDGKGVQFSFAISGLPAGTGPWMYHIHEKPVPADGNCTGTGAHLDPYKRGETPACNPEKPESCQTGDLAGKFSNFTSEADSKAFLDLYSATDPSNPAYFGNLSIVVHTSNKSRIACANFTQQAPGAISTTLSASSGFAAPTGAPISNGTLSSSLPTGTGSPSGGHSGAGESTYKVPEPTSQPPPPQTTTSGAERLALAGAAVLAGIVALIL